MSYLHRTVIILVAVAWSAGWLAARQPTPRTAAHARQPAPAQVAALVRSGMLVLPAGRMNQVTIWHQESGEGGATRVNAWYEAGRPAAEITIYREKLHGNWRSWYDNGVMKDSGRFSYNLPDGIWKFWTAEGRLSSIRQYDAGKYETIALAIHRRNPKLAFSPLASAAIQRPELWKQATAPLAGFWILPGMPLPELPFSAGLLHGLFTDFHANGQPAETGHYSGGWKEGVWQQFTESGRLMVSGHFLHGEKHGSWKTYNDQGMVTELSQYRHGKLMHQKKWMR